LSRFLEKAKSLQPELTTLRRALHAIPEVGKHLPNTAAFLMEKLKEMGYAPKEISPFGIVAEAGKGTPVFLLRADMDALPVREESGLPFASQNGCAHVCGHDLHMAMLLGAAKLLKENEENLKGTVRFMFQPDEEGMSGAADMIAAGVLEQVEAALALHVMPGLPTGVIAAALGPVMASQDRFRLEVTGKGGHGAKPEQTIDPINAAAHVYLAWQEILAREVKSSQPVVITVGSFHAGHAANVIPETAVLEGTIRTFDKETKHFVKQRLEEIAHATARAFRAKSKLDFYGEIPAVVNEEGLTRELISHIQEAGLHVVPWEKDTVSEDFSFISQRVPAALFFLGTGETEDQAGLHHPRVTFDENVLRFGAAALAQCAERWLAKQAKG
jgi:amidohydrolase